MLELGYVSGGGQRRPSRQLDDTSGSAMFVYAIQQGIDLGYLSADTYSDVVQTRLRRNQLKAVINKEGCSIFTTLAMALVFSGAMKDYIHAPRWINAKEAVGGFCGRQQLSKSRYA